MIERGREVECMKRERERDRERDGGRERERECDLVKREN